MSDFRGWNQKIVDEFRSNEGRVGGPFEGAPMIIIHTKGRKSGKDYENPLVYLKVGDAYAIFGSKGGAPEHPEWYQNIVANPEIEAEIGAERFKVRARELKGDEREPIWTKQKKLMPGFAEYEQKAQGIREIPVILLERI